ncbi:hypothetical protein GH825_30535, partial [Bacillus thuringiensis]|nr:hypothetical protein [Bacillus thuringiensis]
MVLDLMEGLHVTSATPGRWLHVTSATPGRWLHVTSAAPGRWLHVTGGTHYKGLTVGYMSLVLSTPG